MFCTSLEGWINMGRLSYSAFLFLLSSWYFLEVRENMSPPPLVKSLHTGLLLFACISYTSQSNQYPRHLHSPFLPAIKKWKELKIFTHAFLPGTLSVAERICASKKRYDTSWIDTSVSCDRFPPGQVFTILRLRTRDCGLGKVKLWCEHSNLSTLILTSPSSLITVHAFSSSVALGTSLH